MREKERETNREWEMKSRTARPSTYSKLANLLAIASRGAAAFACHIHVASGNVLCMPCRCASVYVRACVFECVIVGVCVRAEYDWQNVSN